MHARHHRGAKSTGNLNAHHVERLNGRALKHLFWAALMVEMLRSLPTCHSLAAISLLTCTGYDFYQLASFSGSKETRASAVPDHKRLHDG